MTADAGHVRDSDIAIVGMAGRFPGAPNLDRFWKNLMEGVEHLDYLTDEELARTGITAEHMADPGYVRLARLMPDAMYFDASFFNMTPREAQLIDPQQRVFMEVVLHALQDAGYDPGAYSGLIGLYAGTGFNNYLTEMLPDAFAGRLDVIEALTSNAADYLCTRASYHLNLRGPSVDMQSACSTSLVAIHSACQSLIAGECDMAVGGGIAIRTPQHAGYDYVDGNVQSRDGRVRSFDIEGSGMAFGSGTGVVVLKLLSDALRDGDNIRAVIKGTAINNDGADKAGYTAPSESGQAAVISDALSIADIEPSSIDYIETHGTATPVGDPIEVGALNRAFAGRHRGPNTCGIGSVKTNIGHMDAAAGVAGLIKTTLSLQNGLIPASLNFKTPNPNVPFDQGPFFVNAELRKWPDTDTPHRAGVSAYGVGGTNAHVVVEQAPVMPPSGPSRSAQLLLLSTRSRTSLETATSELARHLEADQQLSFADAAYTLKVGRARRDHRRALVCSDTDEAIHTLQSPNPLSMTDRSNSTQDRPVIFMFSGQGSQYVNMAKDLYDEEPSFRLDVDRCSEILQPHLGLDLREVIYPHDDKVEESNDLLAQTWITQPAVFTIEYAMARLWMSIGIQPIAMIGHSLGEYVAACLAGVFSLEDALRLIARRGRLSQDCESGSMMSLEILPTDLEAILPRELSIAAINGPMHCVVAGPTEHMERFKEVLTGRDQGFRPLHISHAFHSSMMEPAMEPFRREFDNVTLNPPTMRLISNVTGKELSADEATDPDYWVRHIRTAVRFAEGIQTAAEGNEAMLLEAGPGRALATLAGLQQDPARISTSLRHPKERQNDLRFFLAKIGEIWTAGVDIDWDAFYAREDRRRVSLPAYPFERQEYVAPGNDVLKQAFARSRPVHPLLGYIEAQPPSSSYTLSLKEELPEYLLDHRVYDMAILPATAYLEMGLACAKRIGWAGECVLRDVHFERACPLDEESRDLTTSIVPDGNNRFAFRIYSSDTGANSETRWTLHARGEIERSTTTQSSDNLAEIRERCSAGEFTGESIYASMDAVNFHFGPAFRGLQHLWYRRGEALGQVVLPEHLKAGKDGYTIHPAFLDSCLHILNAAYPENTEDGPYWPASTGSLRVLGEIPDEVWTHAVGRHGKESGTLEMDLRLLNADGAVVAEFKNLLLRKIQKTVKAHTEDDPSDWLYNVEWIEVDELEPGETRPTLEAPWVILEDRNGLGRDLAQRLDAVGESSVLISEDDDERWKKLDAALTAELSPHGLVALWGLNTEAGVGEPDRVMGSTLDTVRVARAILDRSPQNPSPLWLVTRGAQTTTTDDPLTAPSQAPLWGLGRCIAAEHANLDTTLIDLDGSDTIQDAEVLRKLLGASHSETQYAERAGRFFVPRLVSYKDQSTQPLPEIHEDASYLITGGLGGLGLACGKRLVERGAKNLVLMGRSAPDENTEAELAALREQGIHITVAQADISDFDAVSKVFDEIDANLPPLRGVVHSAGVIDDRGFMDQDTDSFIKVMSPKIPGTWNLHRLTADREIDFFALFSSVSSIVGNPGQSNYAAANCYMDAFAAWRQQQGLPAVSMNWGAWAEIGLAARWQPEKALLGWPECIPVKEGLDLFDRFLQGREWQIAVFPYHKETYVEWFAQSGGTPSLFKELLREFRIELGTAAVVRYPRPDLVDEYVAPRNKREKAIIEVWESFLRIAPLGIDDNFFELGGNSLLAAQVTTRINATLGVHLNVSALLETLTVARLAALLDESVPVEDAVMIPLKSVDRSESIPASFSQQLLWFQSKVSGVFSIPVAHIFEGSIDVKMLEKAINEIILRHETLRTELRPEGNQLMQVIHPHVSRGLEVVDLRNASHEEIQAVAQADTDREFEGASDPLLRAKLYKLPDERQALMMLVHHLVFDMVSIGVLHRELSTLYHAFTRGEPSPLKPLAIQYGDFAVWERRRFESLGTAEPDPVLEKNLDYWKTYLKDLPMMEFPVDVPLCKEHQVATIYETMNPQTEASLRALALEERATVFVTALAAFQVLLGHYNGRDEEVVNTVSGRRERAELELMIGAFFEPMSVRASLGGNPSFRRVVDQVRDGLNGGYRHGLPTLKIIEAMPEIAGGTAKSRRVVFIFNPVPAQLELTGTKPVLQNDIKVADSDFPVDLCIGLLEPSLGDGLVASIGYNERAIHKNTATTFLTRYQRLLDLACNDADRGIVELLSEACEEST